jgi:hypothetical protein
MVEKERGDVRKDCKRREATARTCADGIAHHDGSREGWGGPFHPRESLGSLTKARAGWLGEPLSTGARAHPKGGPKPSLFCA